MKMKSVINYFLLLVFITNSGCASLALEKRLKRNDIRLNSIEISNEKRPYYTITLGKEPNKNIIFYLTGTGCHDPVINASLLFDNPLLNATVFILPKNGVIPNQFGKSCSPKYIENDNLQLITDDTRSFIEKKLLSLSHIRGQKVILYGESEGADIAVRLANHFEKVTDIIITHRGTGLNNTDERNLSHQLRLSKNEVYDIDSSRLTEIANGALYPPEMMIFRRKAKNWNEFFAIKQAPIQLLYQSRKKILIYLGKKDLTSPFHTLALSMKYFCEKKSNKLTAIVDKKAGHQMHPYFKSFSNLKNFIEQWIIIGDPQHLNFQYPLEKLSCQ